MKDDFTPAKKPQPRPVAAPAARSQQDTRPIELPRPETLQLDDSARSTEGPTHRRMSWWKWLIIAVVVAVLAAVVGSYGWYQTQLRPVSSDETAERIRVDIKAGASPEMIATQLAENGVIKNAFAFRLYAKFHGVEDRLQAGSYSFSPAFSTPEVVNDLTSGNEDTIDVTFLPGATVEENKAVLRKLGYTKSDIDTAFAKRYDHPVFAGKPVDTDLEGYVYGETYRFATTATVETILMRTFDELESVVEDNNLISKYKAKGLTLYEGITLASIIQREVNTPADQKQVAQVFLLRLKKGEPLGSDVTYQYAADKMGVARDPALKSDYNTRIHRGLPPGPISAPGLSALQAVANPASGDYLFFLSGDDDKTYFAHTQAEHERNIKLHCQQKCQIL